MFFCNGMDKKKSTSFSRSAFQLQLSYPEIFRDLISIILFQFFVRLLSEL